MNNSKTISKFLSLGSTIDIAVIEESIPVFLFILKNDFNKSNNFLTLPSKGKFYSSLNLKYANLIRIS